MLRMKKNGYTLIEFLVVIGILVFAVGSSLLFLTSILRGSNQSNISAEVKQNGQAVLDTLDSQMRNGTDAKLLTGADNPGIPGGSSPNNAIRVTLADGTFLYIACFNTVGTTSNGWIGTSTTGASPYTSITNTDIVSGVHINCNPPNAGKTFSVGPSSTLSPAVVSVSFVVNQAAAAPSRQDYKANVTFQTTISLRKY